MHAHTSPVQTSAQQQPPEFDLFGEVPAAPSLRPKADVQMRFVGVVEANAQLRVLPPTGRETDASLVVCVDVDRVGPANQRLSVRWPFHSSQRSRAEELVAGLTAGKHVVVTTHLVDARLILPHVDAIDFFNQENA